MNDIAQRNIEPLTVAEREYMARIVAIYYIDDRPHQVITEHEWDNSKKSWNKAGKTAKGLAHSDYDFDWCKTHQTLYQHNSGGGGGRAEAYVNEFCEPNPPPGKLWVACGTPIVRNSIRARKHLDARALLKMGYILIDEPLTLILPGYAPTTNPFECSEESETVYCQKCDDHLPRPDGDEVCKHIKWCEDCGWWAYSRPHRSADSGQIVKHKKRKAH